MNTEEKVALLRDCIEISYDCQANMLDCSVSTHRQKADPSVDEILDRFTEDAHVVVINRGTRGDTMFEREHFEIGYRSMGAIDYYLFITVESEKMPMILDKYNLR